MDSDILNKIIEAARIIVPTVISSFATFLITRYTYYKSIPNDKLEIAYNRFYYPVYILIHEKYKGNQKGNYDKIIIEISPRIIKYRKYLNSSTLKLFNSFAMSIDAHKQKAYENFTNNIYDHNLKLRKRIGYLGSNVLLDAFKYGGPNVVGWMFIMSGFLFLSLFLFVYPVFLEQVLNSDNVLHILVTLLLIVFTGLILIIYDILIKKIKIFVYFVSMKRDRNM